MVQCLEHKFLCLYLCSVCGFDFCLPRAGVSDDLWRLSLSTLEWTNIEVVPGGVRPSGRENHVMTSVGLDLWVHGGLSVDSGEGDGCMWNTRGVIRIV